MLEAIQRCHEEAAKAAASSPCLLSDTDLRRADDDLHQLQKMITGLQITVTQEIVARGLLHEDGHRDTAARLRNRHRMDRKPARELAHAVDALRARPQIVQALLDGRIDLQQATLIADTVNHIPAELADFPAVSAGEVADQAEAFLLDKAVDFSTQHLRGFAERILAHVAPQIAERAEEEALRRQEARAHRKRGFTQSSPVNGMVRLSGRLSVEDAATVAAALHPLCHPAPGDERSAEQKRADALVELCRLALRTGDLPAEGGEPPQLAVTVAFNTLVAQLGIGVLPDGQRVTPETARRLACDARLLPFVLGGQSQVLDAGRSRRTATGPLRRALTIRDRGCTFPGCELPARWTDAHHLHAWADGGTTDLDNLILLCRRHHRLLHHPTGGWQARMSTDRLPEFIPPPWVDPLQIPRRNTFHTRV